jgi:predicted nuclease of predicted toxin-antitoxin system
MKLLLDQGLPRSAVNLLVKEGIDSIHVADLGMSSAEDWQILEQARKDGMIVVTLDADFHSLLALTAANSPSVIRIRIERLRAQALTDLLTTIINTCRDELKQGSALSIESNRIRIRRLPLIV